MIPIPKQTQSRISDLRFPPLFLLPFAANLGVKCFAVGLFTAVGGGESGRGEEAVTRPGAWESGVEEDRSGFRGPTEVLVLSEIAHGGGVVTIFYVCLIRHVGAPLVGPFGSTGTRFCQPFTNWRTKRSAFFYETKWLMH
ncbi:hypothetical protein HPP92_007414 [Vanilla planifolia]|uniref:Uncharacterized protein n=1 Tax=Vanilla planifolia TaxID=51239 RepID=A0A835RE25_VANPL|nr:hypothetical protein HPP92_007414 [Vanilla planifolia]